MNYKQQKQLEQYRHSLAIEEGRAASSGLIRDSLGFAAIILFFLYAVPWIYFLATGELFEF